MCKTEASNARILNFPQLPWIFISPVVMLLQWWRGKTRETSAVSFSSTWQLNEIFGTWMDLGGTALTVKRLLCFLGVAEHLFSPRVALFCSKEQCHSGAKKVLSKIFQGEKLRDFKLRATGSILKEINGWCNDDYLHYQAFLLKRKWLMELGLICIPVNLNAKVDRQPSGGPFRVIL